MLTRMLTGRSLIAIAGLLLLSTGPASAEVIERSANGFTIKSTVTVAASPDRAFKALTDPAAWWDKAHTYSGDAKNLSIAAQPGGCFCERLPAGGGVEHGRVVNLVPGSLLRIQTALGPLQELGVTGSLSWQVAKAADGSTITMTYAVGGFAPTLEKLAPLVDQVLTRQITLLKAHLDQR